MAKPKKIVRFRDKRGRFVSPLERYTEKVYSVQTIIRGKLYTKWERDLTRTGSRNLTASVLSNVIKVDELQSLPSIPTPVKVYKSSKEFQLWDIAQKIDKRKDIRGKFFRLDIKIKQGKRTRTVPMYYNIANPGPANYKLFEAMLRKLQSKKVTTVDRNDPNFERHIASATQYGRALIDFLDAAHAGLPKAAVVKILSVLLSFVEI